MVLKAFSTQSTMSWRLGGGIVPWPLLIITTETYTADLKQGGLELPAEFRFTAATNENLLRQMKEKTLIKIKKFEENWAKAEEAKKKKNPKTNYFILFLFFTSNLMRF